jgi:hypothetical protein
MQKCAKCGEYKSSAAIRGGCNALREWCASCTNKVYTKWYYVEQNYGELVELERIHNRFNSLLRSAIARHLVSKKRLDKNLKGLAYSAAALCEHIEAHFVNGMSWSNARSWDLDHIVPFSWFELLNKNGTWKAEGIQACYMLCNLRPLWHKDNISRPDTVDIHEYMSMPAELKRYIAAGKPKFKKL